MQHPHLPESSVAEFRRAAHEHYEIPYILAPPYLPTVGLRGFIGGLFILFGMVSAEVLFSSHDWKQDTLKGGLGVVIFGGGGVALVVSKIRSRRRMRRLNCYLVEASRRIDAMYERGEIALAPAEWDGEIPPTLSNYPIR